MEIIKESRNDILDTDFMLVKWIHDIQNNINFTLIRFGDGELANIQNYISKGSEKLHNCDHCYYYHDLGLKLKEAYQYFLNKKDTYIAIWNKQYKLEKELNDNKEIINFVSNDIILNRMPDLIDKNSIKIKMFKTIINSERHKIYVSNIDNIRNLAHVLKVNSFVYTPNRNAYNYDDVITNNVIQELKNKKNCIILFSIGTYSKYLIYKLHKIYGQAHSFIDIGTSFDGLFKQNRDYNSQFEYKYYLKSIYDLK